MWTLEQGWEHELEDGTFEPPPSPALVINDAGHLRAALNAKAAGPPFIYTLRSDDGERLGVWLGGSWGIIERGWETTNGRSYRTAQPLTPTATVEVNFDNGREGCLIGPNDLLPAAEVVDAAVYFFERRELSPRLNWVGWDA